MLDLIYTIFYDFSDTIEFEEPMFEDIESEVYDLLGVKYDDY